MVGLGRKFLNSRSQDVLKNAILELFSEIKFMLGAICIIIKTAC